MPSNENTCPKWSAEQQKILQNIKVDASTGCWVWQKHLSNTGYGDAYINKTKWRAHRLSWTAFVGTIPDGLLVCHHCDNPGCCNPDHLFTGTSHDNMIDMMAKGRGRGGKSLGPNNANAKLNESQVVEIRKLLIDGLSHDDIGTMFNVSSQTISSISTGRTWAHLKEGANV